ncbi:GIN domain-containing protein, partial [Caulobacter sp.]|uniref:GIN domain-containing protein n=1 Tax=Caulobacter sp. TaxID=78 RepID=UPI002B4A3A1B
MRAVTTLAVLAAAISTTGAIGGAASAAPSVKIKDAVARVVVIPENRSDVKVEFLTTNASLPLTVRQDGGDVIVDGDLRMSRINGCNSRNGKVWVRVRGVGEVSYDNFPQIAVRTPLNVKVQAGGAVFGDIGRSDSVSLGNAGCGDWTVANTKGKLEVSQAGSGDTKTGTAESAEINIAGSGDVSTQAIAGDLEVHIAGSGDVSAASIAGQLDGNIAGSGNISVAGGHSRSIEVSVMGSGDVTFGGEADSVDVSVAGSGDVRIA